MKTKKIKRKLTLSKETICRLNSFEQSNVKGGFVLTIILDCGIIGISLAYCTRGKNCDVWSFGETDCALPFLRDLGRE